MRALGAVPIKEISPGKVFLKQQERLETRENPHFNTLSSRLPVI
uniref:Uncharacterized protein n=1 Tax=Anguilla anguilla TaxID=7936 RepID=A0A0E9P5Y7_ANGAN